MRSIRWMVGVVLMLAVCAAEADVAAVTSDLDLVKTYMLAKDYPEQFGGKSYHVKIEDALVAPVLNDGTHDVVVLVTPNYRQSATVLIYKIAQDHSVSRVTEGLAPGPLVPVSGKYLDSHAIGQGFDVQASKGQGDPATQANLIKAGLKTLGGMVLYRNFTHGDSRNGSPWFVDMSDVESPLEADNCSKFEFSLVDQLAAGEVAGGGKQLYLVASVGKQLYFYVFDGLRKDGLLNKRKWVTPLPAGFKQFVADYPSAIEYLTDDGQTKPLAAPK